MFCSHNTAVGHNNRCAAHNISMNRSKHISTLFVDENFTILQNTAHSKLKTLFWERLYEGWGKFFVYVMWLTTMYHVQCSVFIMMQSIKIEALLLSICDSLHYTIRRINSAIFGSPLCSSSEVMMQCIAWRLWGTRGNLSLDLILDWHWNKWDIRIQSTW